MVGYLLAWILPFPVRARSLIRMISCLGNPGYIAPVVGRKYRTDTFTLAGGESRGSMTYTMQYFHPKMKLHQAAHAAHALAFGHLTLGAVFGRCCIVVQNSAHERMRCVFAHILCFPRQDLSDPASIPTRNILVSSCLIRSIFRTQAAADRLSFLNS